MPKDHRITLATAVEMTTRYRQQRPENYPVCESFEKAAIESLLAQNGASFLRIYYGMKDSGEVDAVLVAADASGQDILPVQSNLLGDGDEILEDSFRCPVNCPPDSPLNGG
jgi:hypothetical protein